MSEKQLYSVISEHVDFDVLDLFVQKRTARMIGSVDQSAGPGIGVPIK